MKLARCQDGGAIFWGVVDLAAGLVHPIEGEFDQWAPRVTAGEGTVALRLEAPARAISAIRLLPPIEKTKRVVVAGASNDAKLLVFRAFGDPFTFSVSTAATSRSRSSSPVRLPTGTTTGNAMQRSPAEP